MKASKFSDAQKAFIIRQGENAAPNGDFFRVAHEPQPVRLPRNLVRLSAPCDLAWFTDLQRKWRTGSIW